MPRVLIGLMMLLGVGLADAQPRPLEHELRTGGEVTVRPGEVARASITIDAARGFRIHPGAPLRLSLSSDPPGGLVLPRRRLRRRDAADPRAEAPRFDLPFTAPKSPGTHRILVEARFWLCARRTCWPVRDSVAIAVTVAEPAPAAPPPVSPAPSSPGAQAGPTGAIP